MPITIVSPTPGVAAGGVGGFSIDPGVASQTPIVVQITTTSHELVQMACPGFTAAERIVCRDGVVQGDWVAKTVKTIIAGGYQLAILPSKGWSPNILSKLAVSVDTVAAGGNIPPVAAFAASLVSNRTYSVLDSSTDSDGTIVTWDWDWGDGTGHGSTATPGNHTYTTDGVKTITLTVTDNLGATNPVSHNVTVAGWTVDATSGKGVPASTAEWTNLLAQAGVSKGPPTYIWGCQDAASPLTEISASNNFSAPSGSGTLPTFNNAKAGWSRKFVNFAGNSGRYIQSAVSFAGSKRTFVLGDIFGTGSANTVLYDMGELGFDATLHEEARFGSPGAGTFAVGAVIATGVRPFFFGNDDTIGSGRASNDVERVVPAYASAAASPMFLGAAINNSPNMSVGYMCQWTGTDAEWSGYEEKLVMAKLGYANTWAAWATDATATTKAIPKSKDDWASILVASGVSKNFCPSNGWDFGAVVSGTSVPDIIGGARPITISLAAITYAQAITGYSQKAIRTTAGAVCIMENTTIPDPASNSVAQMLIGASLFGSAGPRTIMRMGTSFDDDICMEQQIGASAGKLQIGNGGGASRVNGTVVHGTGVHQFVLQSNLSGTPAVTAFTELEKIAAGTPAVSTGTHVTYGGDNGTTWYPDQLDSMLGYFWSGTAAQMTSAQWKSILTTMGATAIPWS